MKNANETIEKITFEKSSTDQIENFQTICY